jgi:hypothetical protein
MLNAMELARREAVDLVMAADKSLEDARGWLADVQRRLYDTLSPAEESELEGVINDVREASESLSALAERLDENSGNDPWLERG